MSDIVPDLDHYLSSMMEFRKAEPIHLRGDILGLKKNFDGITPKFIRAHAMRETALVNAFYQGGFEAVKKVGKIKYIYLPRLLIRYMKPEAVETWTDESVQLLADKLKQAVQSGTVADYKMAIKFAKKIKGIGAYSSEHLFRSACLMVGTKHPSKSFVRMGSGANYSTLRKLGITNIDQLNHELTNRGYDTIDAGEIAYLICMNKNWDTIPEDIKAKVEEITQYINKELSLLG